MKNPITWSTERRKVTDLLPADYNPRKMSDQERRDLEESIQEFGQVVPVAVNIGKRAGVLIGGHQRTSIYADLGIKEVDVMVPSRELTLAEEKKLNLRLNKNTGSWDFEKLKDMNLSTLLDVGFGDEDLQTLWDDVDVIEDGFNGSKAVREVKVPTVHTGERWQLGDHILMCGDSSDPEQVAHLMGKDLADLAYLQLPKTKPKKYEEAMTRILANAVTALKPNAHVFFWVEDKHIGALQALFNTHKIVERRLAAWIRKDTVLTANVAFNRVLDFCLYGTKGDAKLSGAYKNLVEILNKEVTSGNQIQEEVLDALDLWVVNQKSVYLGDTSKPVTLHERPLKRCTSPGDVILDLHGDTGSVLIACEQIRRKARVMEADPIHASVIVNRWEVLTNLKAKKI